MLTQRFNTTERAMAVQNTQVVPLNDLQRRFVNSGMLKAEILDLITRGPYLNGAFTKEFEERFANFIGSKWSIALSSGTTALELAIKSLNLPKGSRVALAANAGGYASVAILNSGMIPYYVEIDKNGLVNLSILENEINNFSLAIITHLYGQAADIERIYSFLKSKGKYLIEDCAHSTGAKLGNKLLGNFSDVSAFSFYPTKNLGAIGDAGAICTSDKSLFNRILDLRQYGWSTRYYSSTPNGGNYRVDELQCLVLLHQLKKLDENNSKRREIWRRYRNATKSNKYSLLGSDDMSFVAHLGVFLVPDRVEFQEFMQSQLIDTAIHYPFPDYVQPGISKNLKLKLPKTDLFCKSVVTVPLFPEMSGVEISRVESAISDYTSQRN